MSKQFVSLNEALGYLQFLNTDNQAFTGKAFKMTQPSGELENRQAIIRKPSQTYRLKERQESSKNAGEENQGKKTLNKNRAIKRTIDTSKEILSANYKYEQPQPNDKKSYKTQFNIYLKQYNRLSEQILSQENEREEKKRNFIEHEEGQLQNVYSYTVEDDFRELVQVSILKDKINKKTFKLCLVLVKTNEMKIYDAASEESHRDIRLHQIQNVDYFSQPYIFTVMTIVKDKSSTSEYLCFRFDCLEKQHKWDRAIYCNYICRKMKKKGKYFLLQFPEKEEEKQNNEGLEHVTKKRDDNRNYEVDRKKIIKNLQGQRQKQGTGTRMGTAGMESDRDLPTTEKRFNKMERFNTENQINLISPSRENTNYNMMSTKNADQKQYFQSGFKGTTKKKEGEMADNDDDLSASQKTSKPNTSARPIPNPNQNPNTNSVSNSNSVVNPTNSPTLANQNATGNVNSTISPTHNQSPTLSQSMTRPNDGKSPENQPQKQQNRPNFINDKMAESQIQIQSRQSKKIINPFTKRKIELREKHEKGIRVDKMKFFSDKSKIIYLGNDELEYWDFDASTMHKSEKKLIQLKELKQHKIVKEKEKVYILLQLKNKTLEFLGKIQELNDIEEWIELQKKEKEFQISKSVKNVKEEGTGNMPNIFLL